VEDVEDPQDKTSGGDPAGGDQVIDQAAIDALLGGGSAPEEPSSSEPADSAGAINQSDIDTLMQAAGSSDVGGESEAAAATPDSAPSETDSRLDSLGRPFDEAAVMMQAAIEEERQAEAAAAPPPAPSPPPAPPPNTTQFQYPKFKSSLPAGVDAKRVTMLNDVNLRVKIQLGKTQMLVEDVLKLGEGSVVELDKLAGDPVDVLVNDRLVARGEVLVLNDNFCVRVSEILSRDPHRITA
jgi:flagellar motor switch protein FliN/FliY